MPRTEGGVPMMEYDARERDLNTALKAAHIAGMSAFENAEELPPAGEAGVADLDGRKKFVKRFKSVGDELGTFESTTATARRYEHPNPREEVLDSDLSEDDPEYGKRFRPFMIVYDVHERSYILKHRAIEESESMSRKVMAYQAVHKELKKHGYLSTARLFTLPDPE